MGLRAFFNWCEPVVDREAPNGHFYALREAFPAGRLRRQPHRMEADRELEVVPGVGLGDHTRVVLIILPWTGPSPTTWRPFGLLHCPELRRETKAGSVSTRTALPLLSGSWPGDRGTAFLISLKGAKVCQSLCLVLGLWTVYQDTRENKAIRSRKTQPKGRFPTPPGATVSSLGESSENPWPSTSLGSVFLGSFQAVP